MSRRAIFFDDSFGTQRAFAAELRRHGFEVVSVAEASEFERELKHPDFEVVVFGGIEMGPWQHFQQVRGRHAHVPVVYVLINDDPREREIQVNELHQIVRPLSSKKKFIDTVEQVSRIGKLYKRVHQPVEHHLPSDAIEQMFTRLDVHHIIDRVLSYFGHRLELTNLHWFRWVDFQHILSADHESLAIEMEMAQLRSPRMMSFNESDINEVFSLVWQMVEPSDLERLNREKFKQVRLNGRNHLLLVVHSLTDGAPLGLVLLEGIQADGIELMREQVQGTLRLMARFLEFGLSYWDSQALAMKDDLTVLYNQRFLPKVLDNEVNRAQRRGQSFSVLFLDLDYFKLVNDTRGHWIGSALLKEVGRLIAASIRSCDYGFRYGGDEFVIVLPDTHLSGGQIVAERIRKTIEMTPFLIDGQEIRLTASVGLATYPDHAKTKEHLIQLADQAMYYAKRKSRNIVYIAS